MKIFMASLESVSPYSQSRAFKEKRADKETADDFEQRTWRDRCHVLTDGRLFIPPTCFKECIAAAAKYLAVQIPGKGKSTYTKHFRSGVLVAEGPTLPVKKDEVEGETLYLNADGIKGSGKRVWRTMPVIRQWKADVAFHILDETITMEVFRYHLEQAGTFIGIGRFRPQNGGYYGRFKVNEVAEVSA